MSTDARDPRQRAEKGKAARRSLPRSELGAWEPAPRRRSPVKILAAQDKTRVPELVPIRYGRMLDSPFTFYRGAAGIMAADLGAGPDSGLKVQLCGDAHLSNFGVFQAPDRSMVFDINDFDETLPGPFEWDVKRLAASLEIAGRDRGFKRRKRREITMGAVGAYRRTMQQFARMRSLEIWYARLDVEKAFASLQATVTQEQQRRFKKQVAKARNKDSLRALTRLTQRVNGRPRIASRPPVLVPIEELDTGRSPEQIAEQIKGLLAEYRSTLPSEIRRLVDRYEYIDAGHKIVGVGSVGTRAWIVLLLGRDDSDPLFLQVKEAQASVLEPFAKRSRQRHHGHRVVAGQRLMQATGDVLLGWLTAQGPDGKRRDFYVRQLWDGKGSADIELMVPKGMTIYGGLCGWSLARAHARTGDPVAIAGYLGKSERFERGLADFADAYADQNERDYAELSREVNAGGLEIETGV